MSKHGVRELREKAVRNQSERISSDVHELIREEGVRQDVALERLPSERENIDISKLPEKKRREISDLREKVEKLDLTARGSPAVQKLLAFGRTMSVDKEGHVRSLHEGRLRQVSGSRSRPVEEGPRSAPLIPGAGEQEGYKTQYPALMQEEMAIVGDVKTGRREGEGDAIAEKRAELKALTDILLVSGSTESMISAVKDVVYQQGRQIYNIEQILKDHVQVMSGLKDDIAELKECQKAALEAIHDMRQVYVEIGKQTTTAISLQAEGLLAGIKSISDIVEKNCVNTSTALGQILAAVQNLKRFVGSFDAHLADMQACLKQPYQSAYNPPDLPGPTVAETTHVQAPLAPAHELAGKTLLAGKLASLKAATNMSDMDIFMAVPSYAQARKEGNEAAAIKALQDFINERERRGM